MAKRSAPQSPERRSTVRCAIYTRKSTEEGLEQEFNSLDAQRDACSAYIASQRHEGWIEIRDHYDDGGFSGGNMERPGLKRLLADVAAGKVDVILLYKIDRLTRSLSDFAKIVEVLDKVGTSFVSVTQSFNTTSSMGRLMLNVLLSFAQFEREVTGERIRDKVAASKKKGLWMGGPVPLGYEVKDRKLVIHADDAATVRHIFRRYAELGSGQKLLDELREQGYTTKRQQLRDGRVRGGRPFERGMLFHLLGNRTYLGEIVHKGAGYLGEHPAIVDRELWETVQQRIGENAVERRSGRNMRAASLLAGIIFDGHGRRMSPSHAAKNGRRYRYYITHSSELREGEPPAWRIPAHDVETAAVQRLASWLNGRRAIRELVALVDGDAACLSDALAKAARSAEQLASTYHRRGLIASLVDRAELQDEAIALQLRSESIAQLLGIPKVEQLIIVTAPTKRVRRGKEVKLIVEGDADSCDHRLVRLLAEARTAQAQVIREPTRTIRQIAAASSQCSYRLSRLVRLAHLAPEIIEAILAGTQPLSLTPRKLLATPLPMSWDQQKAALGFS